MRLRDHIIIVTIIVILLGTYAGSVGVARAADGACSVTQARRDVAAAKRALARAEARLREARHVLRATRQYSELYGARVGRWVRLSRRTGWTWPDFPVLMRVMDAESGGDPNALNAYSACAGLMQLHPCWYEGVFDPFAPRLNLAKARYIRRTCGWQSWTTY